MTLPLKRTTVLGLILISLLLSRAAFVFISDPEGPNMVVVFGLALIIFLVLSAAVLFWRTR